MIFLGERPSACTSECMCTRRQIEAVMLALVPLLGAVAISLAVGHAKDPQPPPGKRPCPPAVEGHAQQARRSWGNGAPGKPQPTRPCEDHDERGGPW